jgi:myosin heavy subunit
LTNATNKSGKLQADVAKCRKDYDDLHCQVRDTKSELTRVKKELTSTKKKIVEQLSSTLSHKERMKDKELEKERIRFDKTKESSLSKLLSQERSHANTLARTEHRYDKAEKVNLDRHTRKTTTETQKTDTAVARAAQAAVNVQLAQNAGHFPNPRGVDLERVSFCLLFTTITAKFVSNMSFCHYWTLKDMGTMLTRSNLRQPTLTQMDFVKPVAQKRPPLPKGWQRNTCEATGDPFYSHVASGRIVFRFEDMKTNRQVTPSQAASAAVELFPDNPVSGAAVFGTPRRFKDGSSSKPVMLDDDEVSEALSDLTNSQMNSQSQKKRPAKRQRRVFRPAETEGTVTGEEGFESVSVSDENLDLEEEMSPNLLD